MQQHTRVLNKVKVKLMFTL